MLASEVNERLTGTQFEGRPYGTNPDTVFLSHVQILESAVAVIQYHLRLRKNFVDLVEFHLFHLFSLLSFRLVRSGVRFRGCDRPAAVLYRHSLARRRPKSRFGDCQCDLGSSCRRHTVI